MNLSGRSDPIKLVDASSGAWLQLGALLAARFAVVVSLDPDTNGPIVPPNGDACIDPAGLRFHDLKQVVQGVEDRRFAFQMMNDFEAGAAGARDGDAPFGQSEYFSSANRSTRYVDNRGGVALPRSLERIIDAEDGRYARALVCDGPPLEGPELVGPGDPDTRAGLDTWEGVTVADPITGADAGGVTFTEPHVSVGGVTIIGQGAADAARAALADGGSPTDALRAAVGGSGTATRSTGAGPAQSAGETAERGKALPPTEPRDAGGDYVVGNPAGYVYGLGSKRVGLLGTLVDPGGANGSYATGVHGTEIGTLPLRHDAQVSAGPGMVGRMPFSGRIATAPRGRKEFRGEFQFDPALANIGSKLGHETGQWVIVVGVDGRIPPSRVIERETVIIERERDRKPPPKDGKPQPPRPETGGPPKPATGAPPPEPVSDGPGREDPSGNKPQLYGGGAQPQPPGGGGSPAGGGAGGGTPTGGNPPSGGGSDGGAGEGEGGGAPATGGAKCGAGPGDAGPRGGPSSGGTGTGGSNPAGGGKGLPEVSAPQSQERDYEAAGVPCPNSVAGVVNNECGKTTAELVGGMVQDENGRMVDTHGHPAMVTAFWGDQVRYHIGGSQPLTGAEGQL